MTEKMNEAPHETELGSLVAKAQSFALRFFGQRQDSRLLVHNYGFAAALAAKAAAIAAEERLDQEAAAMACLAAWLFPLGHLLDYHQPSKFSQEAAARFLSKEAPEGAPHQGRVLGCLRAAAQEEAPASPEAAVLCDALQAVRHLHESEFQHASLQLERELMLNQRYTRAEWARILLEELLRVKLYTHYGQAQLQPLLAQAIHQTRLELEKRLEKEEERAGPYGALEKGAPTRGVQTFFRTNYRNHINLSAIADNKANIMISVNAILISVLITFLSYRNIGENKPEILLPVVIFLVTGLASLIFAVLAARPKVTMLNPPGTTPEQARQNIVFFGNFVQLDLEAYEQSMDELFNDSQLLYGNMVRDMYHLGKVLEKKYRYLAISYNLFMAGFIATVLTFLIALFT
jgi:hypothetical protein